VMFRVLFLFLFLICLKVDAKTHSKLYHKARVDISRLARSVLPIGTVIKGNTDTYVIQEFLGVVQHGESPLKYFKHADINRRITSFLQTPSVVKATEEDQRAAATAEHATELRADNEYSTDQETEEEPLKKLGNGGFGVTYKALGKKDNKLYAIKSQNINQLSINQKVSEEKIRSLLTTEFTLCQKMNGKTSFVPCFDKWEADGVFWISMALAKGRPFSLGYFGPEPSKLRNIAKNLITAVKTMFDSGIIHHDLKDDNIFLDGENLNIIDWGGAIDFLDDTFPYGRHPATEGWEPPEYFLNYEVGRRDGIVGADLDELSKSKYQNQKVTMETAIAQRFWAYDLFCVAQMIYSGWTGRTYTPQTSRFFPKATDYYGCIKPKIGSPVDLTTCNLDEPSELFIKDSSYLGVLPKSIVEFLFHLVHADMHKRWTPDEALAKLAEDSIAKLEQFQAEED